MSPPLELCIPFVRVRLVHRHNVGHVIRRVTRCHHMEGPPTNRREQQRAREWCVIRILFDLLARGKHLQNVGYGDAPVLHPLPSMTPEDDTTAVHALEYTLHTQISSALTVAVALGSTCTVTDEE